MNLRKTAVIGGALIALVGLLSFPRLLFGSDDARAKELSSRPACNAIGWRGRRNRALI